VFGLRFLRDRELARVWRGIAVALLIWAVTFPWSALADWRTPKLPPAFDPSAIRDRLARVESAEISRACGNIVWPWAYRGAVGRELAMKSYGLHRASRAWARAMARRLLEGAMIDTATKVSGTKVECDPATAAPIYLVAFHERGRGLEYGDRTTYALLRFDIGAVVLFDAEAPLGMIEMSDRADSLWAALAAPMEDDPRLRGPRPAASPAEAHSPPYREGVDGLPQVLIQTPPAYPMDARTKDVDGLVLIEAKVDTAGSVADAVVLRGPSELRDAALEAVWTWRFKPATSGGHPITVWVMVPVNFKLK